MLLSKSIMQLAFYVSDKQTAGTGFANGQTNQYRWKFDLLCAPAALYYHFLAGSFVCVCAC